VDGIYEWLLERGFAGRKERDVAIELEHEMRMRGASGPSFDSIVASGPHGALPHAQATDSPIVAGTLVTVDIGAIRDGYCSDCTRTFAVGEPTAQAREVYELVLAAQIAGLDALAPGLSGVAVDAKARAVIADAGYGEYFGHGLGHGVGLEIHEPPRLSRHASDEPLRTGNVVTVEPGIYLPGTLGVRIEDLVVLTEDGAARLSRFTKELLVVD
jgi:Xaa-Pro aminopeptidase